MRWASICSGIGSPEVAWADIFGPPAFVAEIDRFPAVVLSERLNCTPPGAWTPGDNRIPNAGGQVAVAFAQNQRGELRISNVAPQITAGGGKPGEGYPAVAEGWTVRRLTPRECERLQGFPDDWTLLPDASKGGWRDVDETENVDDLRERGFRVRQRGNTWRVKDPDGPRYKALGNAMAVNVMRWIGQRIAVVDSIGDAA